MSSTGKLSKPRVHSKKAVFIDRDGVINEDPIGDYVKRWEDFRFLPGAMDALKRLSSAGFQIVIVSNQAGIGDGVYSERDLNLITKNMTLELKKNGITVAGIYYCVHGKKEGCDCRKPRTGLFEKAARDIVFNPSETYFIGDKASDVEAGKNFGLRTVFVLTGHGIQDQSRLTENNRPEKILPSLKEAAEYILESASKVCHSRSARGRIRPSAKKAGIQKHGFPILRQAQDGERSRTIKTFGNDIAGKDL